jgi:NTE family protein
MLAAALLRNVSVFSGLSDELLERLAAQVGEVHARAGEWIMREGDAAESLFVLCSGRVKIIDEGPPERQIRMLRRGDVLGELALLGEGQRSASVRARRDVELLELGRTAFEALIEEAPSFALGLVRTMAAQLATSRTPSVTTNRPRTIAVVGADAAAPTLEVAEDLADALAEHGSVATLNAGTLANIDQAERAANRVILCRGPWR